MKDLNNVHYEEHSRTVKCASNLAIRGGGEFYIKNAIALAALVGVLATLPVASGQTTAKTCPPLSQGFWKTHPSAWTVNSLILGSTTYSESQLLAILGANTGGDASLILAHQLIAAKLNIAVIGTDPSKVAATIQDADTLLGAAQIPQSVQASSSVGQKMVADANTLDSFNNALVTQSCFVPPSSSSGSTAITTGVVNGQLVDKAYVPVSAAGRIAVVNIDSTTPTALITSVTMPAGYRPSATAGNPVTQQVVVVSYTSPDIQIIDSSKDVLIGTVTSPVTQVAIFSGGTCMICGVLIDSATNSAILDTAQGYVLLNLTSLQFSSFIAGTVTGENFGFNPNSRIVLNPTYDQGVTGLQAINLGGGPVSIYTSNIGGNPDATAIDVNTNVAVVPDEFTGNQYLINMAAATFNPLSSPPQFSAPSTVFPLTFTACGVELHDWSMMSVESSTHFLFLGTEFADCAAVESLPTSVTTGAPPTPTLFHWGHMPSPDTIGWGNGGDPHGIAVFTSVVDGKPYGFLVRFDQAWVARVDLTGVENAPTVVGGITDQVDLTNFVFFLKTQ